MRQTRSGGVSRRYQVASSQRQKASGDLPTTASSAGPLSRFGENGSENRNYLAEESSESVRLSAHRVEDLGNATFVGPDRSRPIVQGAEWRQIVAPYAEPSVRKAVWQVVNTLCPYVLVWVLMYRTLAVSWWLTLPFAALAGVLLIRIFIIFHDCGHGSFFPSRAANQVTGFIAGMLTLTPYYRWHRKHSLHHASAGDLDRRGGDVWTMTVCEYLASSRRKRLGYRLARNPTVLFVLVPVFLFVVGQRFPPRKAGSREWRSVMWMNLAILGIALALSWVFGLWGYLLIQLTAMTVAGAAGLWLFYVQHQFEDAYWERKEDWDYTAAALQGSSFYKLPKVLQWLSGNIGFHHIHHLSSRIPNYNLERCHSSHPLFLGIKALTLRSSFNTVRLRLWDEQLGKLVSFRHVKELRRRARGAEKQNSIDRGERAVPTVKARMSPMNGTNRSERNGHSASGFEAFQDEVDHVGSRVHASVRSASLWPRGSRLNRLAGTSLSAPSRSGTI